MSAVSALHSSGNRMRQSLARRLRVSAARRGADGDGRPAPVRVRRAFRVPQAALDRGTAGDGRTGGPLLRLCSEEENLGGRARRRHRAVRRRVAARRRRAAVARQIHPHPRNRPGQPHRHGRARRAQPGDHRGRRALRLLLRARSLVADSPAPSAATSPRIPAACIA